MDLKKIDRWAEMLLDTGKTNNLIKFKDTKASSAEIICPEADALFEKIDGSVSFEVYDPKFDTDSPEREESVSEADENEAKSDEAVVSEATGDEADKPERSMNKYAYYREHAPKLKRANQILVYNSSLIPITAIKNISKKARTALEETGVNVAHMAFGFINWSESEHSDITMNAPLLLVPIYIEQDSSIDPFYIRTTGDDIIVNPTFRFKLQAEYGITIPDYNDESLTDYLAIVSELVERLGWTVSREVKIGIFSFLKLNMYADLRDNKEEIVANENVRKLLGEAAGEPASEATDDSEKEKSRCEDPLLELHNVVDADSSQMEAIEMAKSGKSFVLQGPPGTGKSQTITNIIAELLADGKKVLFVSEKQAALNVVYDKLKKVGLSEFCLELHSHKANKKAVIEDLCHTLRESQKVVSSKAEQEINEKKRRRDQLDKYECELHKKRDVVGKSLFELYDAFSACRHATDIKYSIDRLENKDEKWLAEVVNLLDQYVTYVPSVGYDFRKNAWYGFAGNDASFSAISEISDNLRSLDTQTKDLLVACDELEEEYKITTDTLDNTVGTAEFLELISTTSLITPSVLSCNIEAECRTFATLREYAETVIKEREYLEAEFDEELYRLNGSEINKKLTRQFTNGFTRVFNSEYRKIVSDMRLGHKNAKRVSYSMAVDYSARLSIYQDYLGRYKILEAELKGPYGPAYKGVDSDWNYIIQQMDKLNELTAAGVDFGCMKELESFENVKADSKKHADKLMNIISGLMPSYKYVSGLFHKGTVDFDALSMATVAKRIKECLLETDRIGNWIAFRNLLTGLGKLLDLKFLVYTIDNNIKTGEIPDAIKKAYYRQWIENIINTTPVLAAFTRAAQDKTVGDFSRADLEHFAINKAIIRATLSQKRPSTDFVAEGSDVQVLLREGNKKRKQMPIRTLLSETAEIVQLIKPCFLMSPLSVSTFLASDSIRFDAVVFDEASQIFPQDAIGAIYRARQAIIVGDSKQMPPTNFFNSTMDVDDDDEVGDITDFESILDLCSATMPELRLKWHYRSRYEQLILFSNKNFYDNELITFPSVMKDCTGVGVDYCHVDGVFDRRSKTNRAEAEKVVELVFQNIRNYPNRSIGVVAFSASQADLIDRLLMKARLEHREFEEFFKTDCREPFFIKNLETVQGDERDTIIFSIAYGMGSDGRLLNNFGPINRSGGERRLNVAVSRAKDNVIVVSSMHYTDIDLKGSGSRGASLLREYLDYAENGVIALSRTLSVNEYDRFDSEFELEVCEFLRSRGYKVDTQVGCSSFRIDMAVKHPETSDYVLAVECDGASYHSSKNARDRDRLRQQILENMGWKFYRIWSTDWFRNTAVEKEKLLEAVNASFYGKPEAETACETYEDEDYEDQYDLPPIEFPAYEMYEIKETDVRCMATIKAFQQYIKGILEKEAPLSEEWLLKRICHFFDRSKVTTKVERDFDYYMQDCEEIGIIRRNGFLYLPGDTYVLRGPMASGEIRDMNYIAYEELAAGIVVILEQNIRADRLSLYKVLCNQLGFRRTGPAAADRLDLALTCVSNMVDIDGDVLTIKS